MSADGGASDVVRIVRFHGVCLWRTAPAASSSSRGGPATGASDASTSEVCAICRSDISDLCVECATTAAHGAVELLPSQRAAAGAVAAAAGAPMSGGQVGRGVATCHVSLGACGHAFHSHCMEGWLRAHSKCPLCHDPWTRVAVDLDRSALIAPA
jgi:hypothetical protein